MDANLNQQVFWRGLGVLDEDIEVTVLVEDSRVEQFEFEAVAAALWLCSINSPYGNAWCGYLYKYFMYECVGVLSR